MNNSSPIYSIQVLRGIAAMMVVVHHAIYQMGSRGGRALTFDFGGFQAGVDLFFVISGFIMIFVINKRHQSPLKFWSNRISRIVPLYWFYTLLMAAVVLVFPSFINTAELDVIHLLKSLFFIPTYHPNIENMVWPLLVQGWTLNYEMFFYLIFGALLVVASPGLRIRLLTLVLTGLVIFGLVLKPEAPLWQTYTSPLLLEFLAGALIGEVYVRNYFVARHIAWGCLALGLFFFTVEIWGLGWAQERAVKWGLPSVLVVIGALGLETHRPGNRILGLLGDASYSTYLNHTFTLGAIGFIWSRLGNGTLVFDIFMFIFSIVASAIIGIISYQLIEIPMAKWTQNFGKHRLKNPAPQKNI